MPLQKLAFRPGLNREGTDYANEGGWYDGDKVRFRSGFPEKIGGWSRLSSSTFLGTARNLWNWQALNGSNYLGVGTDIKYYIESGGTYNDITPFVKVNNLSNPTSTITATTDSSSLTIVDVGYSPNVGDYINIAGATGLGPNITAAVINQEYRVASVLSGTTYTVLAYSSIVNAGSFVIGTSYTIQYAGTTDFTLIGSTSNAVGTIFTATGVGAGSGQAGVTVLATLSDSGNGGTYTISYQVPVGLTTYTAGTGWGAGPWSPYVSVALGANPLATTNNSGTVVVTQTAHGYLTNATAFVKGAEYKIVSPGTTNFITLFGASSNAVGTVFIATNDGTVSSGTGTASIVYVVLTGAAPLATTLNGALSASVTTIPVTSNSGFLSTGTVVIDSEYITYTGLGANTLTGCTRGALGSTAEAHLDLTPVTNTTINGIPAATLNTTFEITYLTANTYSIKTPGTLPDNSDAGTIVKATSTGTGGGSAVVVIPQSGTRGWGSAYNAGAGIAQQLRLWSSDNFGQDLVIAPRGGNIFYWQAVNGVGTRAVLLSTLAGSAYVPTKTNQVLSSAIQKFVIAMGANPYVLGNPTTDFNPMLVRWSDQLDQYEWVPSVTNQAGEFPLTNGSFIMGSRATRQEILIWTDSCLYSMQYLGAPYVWGFNIMMDNISIMSPNAMITVNNVTYWMGVDKFYMYSGRVETLPCSLQQYIFNDINKDQAFQVFAGTNEGYNEIWWFYVSDSSAGTTIDKYVIYNYLDRVWYYGSMARTAWLDSGIRQYPMAADYNSRILYHESSVNDDAGDSSQPIISYVQSSDFDIGDGHNFGFVWRILPDINFNGSTVNNATVTMTVRPRANTGSPYSQADSPAVVSADNYTTSQVYNVQQFTGQVYTRLRGRQLAFRIESTGLGVSWQLGTPRIDIRQDGRR